MTLLDPVGQVGIEERNLIITATLLMLLVVVPVIIMTLVFAWKYRASNTSATYTPKWSHSTKIEVVIWTVPILIIIALGVITYKSTHALDPYRPLESDVKPITIEVVAMDWKWMFIYPEQGIATVNKIVFPANTPVNFRITSDNKEVDTGKTVTVEAFVFNATSASEFTPTTPSWTLTLYNNSTLAIIRTVSTNTIVISTADTDIAGKQYDIDVIGEVSF